MKHFSHTLNMKLMLDKKVRIIEKKFGEKLLVQKMQRKLGNC